MQKRNEDQTSDEKTRREAMRWMRIERRSLRLREL